MADFDYLITGAGCAGLSLLVRMLNEPKLSTKQILLVDRSTKSSNDRTWCFWEKEAGFFEEIVAHRWSNLWFHGEDQSRLLPADPYVYKMIRGIDFYTHCLDIIRSHPNVTLYRGDVKALHSDASTTHAIIGDRKITADKIFNSIPFPAEGPQLRHWYCLQHFKGWVIRTLRPAFNPGEATLMDFRTAQEHGAAFFYVMPFSATEALVEYTVFSKEVLPEAEYTARLIEYISRILKIRDYIIREKELGVIPMTTHRFPQEENQIHHIGAAGGLTKPSTGYTFQYIQQDSAAIVRSLLTGTGAPIQRPTPTQFRFYDNVLLNVLMTNKLSGEQVFSRLFHNNNLPDLFAFLDNKSTPRQTWRVIRSLPTGPFARAAAHEMFASI